MDDDWKIIDVESLNQTGTLIVTLENEKTGETKTSLLTQQ